VSRVQRKRLFFALNPDERVRFEVADIQKTCGVDARAVPPANFHLTLAFLGMQEAEAIPRICRVAAGTSFPACELVLDRVDRFKRAGVLWLGASEAPAVLVRFQRQLVEGLVDAGIGHDPKPWKPHLTLYRKMRSAPPTIGPVQVRWPLNRFSLVESVSLNHGVEYHDIASWRAAGQVSFLRSCRK
jgi:2'-5' RNA ligase